MRGTRWLIYALGGGMGHFTRACGLARMAARRGHRVTVMTNSAFAPDVPLEEVLGPGAFVHRINPELSKSAVRETVECVLEGVRPEVLVVDTFPRGLVGELAPMLPGLRMAKVLVHRDLNPAYVAKFNIAEAVEDFDLLLVPGEDAPFAQHPRALRTAPWLLLEQEEWLSRARARERLGVSPEDTRPLVAVMGSGNELEVREAGDIAARLQSELGARAPVRWLAPPGPWFDAKGKSSRNTVRGAPQPLCVWPALAVMPGVDVLVGAGGYNTVQEARVTGTPLVALARARRYDRQAVRLRPEELARTGAELVERAVARVMPRPEQTASGYTSGARDAVALIERTLLSA
ncbi:hypothetical protein [Myxococcus landrumensis]|uniref:Glycosyl transferase family 28 C-terminal domain-containing protein n=1 Tax=Myxococcus landrumensis TaxID=2813577 RepID=A0ABX7N3S4_9BACT|nr:hypothetical protein [Myxococcus landrumus]QSQ12244.1 hypothetical protein JY572_28295 [Myxococcus landrumus]